MARVVKQGARNAAIFMLSIGEEKAAQMFSMLEEHEIRDISREMALLGRVSSDDVERVMIWWVHFRRPSVFLSHL